MAMRKVIIVLVCLIAAVQAQHTTINGVPRQSFQTAGGDNFPSSCRLKDLWLKSGANPGLYSCTATGTPGTWTLQTGAGPQGPPGPQGEQGIQGPAGAQGPQGVQGVTGSQGPAGTAATVNVGTTTTGAAGTNASVTNSGNSSAAVLNFTIPRGDTGAQGPQGNQGTQGLQGIQGIQGPTGPEGPAGPTGPAGTSSVSGITDARVTKTDDTHIAYAGGIVRCLTAIYNTAAIASITLASGTGQSVHVGADCRNAGAIVVARGSMDVTGTGFDESPLVNFNASPWIIPIASIPVVSNVFTTVAEYRTLVSTSAIVPGAGIQCPLNVDGLQECGVDSTVLRNAAYVWLPAVGCSGTTGTLSWDTLASLAPTATCSAGSTETNMMRGTADFPDSDGEYSMQMPIMLPTSWTGTIAVKLMWRAAATSGDVIFHVASACRADAEVDDVAYNTASTVTDTAKGTTNQLNTASIASLTVTGCAAGELMHLKVHRQRTTSGDTITGVVSLVGVELTIGRN